MTRRWPAVLAGIVAALAALGLSFADVLGGTLLCHGGACTSPARLRDSLSDVGGSDSSFLPSDLVRQLHHLSEQLDGVSAWQAGVLGWVPIVVSLLAVPALLARRSLVAVVLSGGAVLLLVVRLALRHRTHVDLGEESQDLVTTGATTWTWLLLLALAAQTALAGVAALAEPSPRLRRRLRAAPEVHDRQGVVELEVLAP